MASGEERKGKVEGWEADLLLILTRSPQFFANVPHTNTSFPPPVQLMIVGTPLSAADASAMSSSRSLAGVPDDGLGPPMAGVDFPDDTSSPPSGSEDRM